MRSISILIIAGVIAILCSYFTTKAFQPVDKIHFVQQTAFERVISSGTIRCGYITWPPAMMKDPNTNELSGINYDVMQQIGRELNLKVEWKEEVGWGNFIEGLNSGRYDMMCSTIWPDADRIKFKTFTRPYYYSAIYGYVRVDDNRFDGQLAKANDPAIKIAVIDGDMGVTEARLDYPRASLYSLPQMADTQELFMAVVTGKADIYFTDEGNFQMFEKNNPGKMRRVADTDASHIYGEFLTLKQGETQLRDMINVAITNLINSGKIETILNKHAPGIYLPPARDYK